MKEIKVPVEVYSRVVGYFRPVNQWNKGKKAEFRDRECLNFELSSSEEKVLSA